MVKTLVHPVYRYFIGIDNDPLMQKFTERMLPETVFKGSLEGYMISKAASRGDGEEVWNTLSQNLMQWNLRKNFKNEKYHKSVIHIECRENVGTQAKTEEY